MSKSSLYAGVAVAALIAGAPAVFAQTAVSQTATNGTATTAAPPVANTGTLSIGAGTMGSGASTAVGATGAVTATSETAINEVFNSPSGGYGAITQTSRQNQQNVTAASVGNTATITAAAGAVTGAGSSVSSSAIGAAASVSLTAIGPVTTTSAATGNISQTASTSKTAVSNTTGFTVNDMTLAGDGSSVSATATGSAATVSIVGIDATSLTTGRIGDKAAGTAVTQNVQTSPTTGSVSNTVTGTLAVGNISGFGASLSVGATGALASVGITSIDSTVTAGEIGRNAGVTSIDHGTVQNSSTVANSVDTVTVGAVGGNGASVSVTATGAATVVGVTAIESDYTAGLIGRTLQNPNNAGVVTNTVGAGGVTTGDLDGDGSSVAVGATGALSAHSITAIDSTYTGSTILQINHNGIANTNTVTNTVGAGGVNTGDINGSGASLSISAAGRVASTGTTMIASTGTGSVYGPIIEVSINTGKITNTAASPTAGNLTGDGTSVAATAIGAIASVGFTSVDTTTTASTTGFVTLTGQSHGSNSTNPAAERPVTNSVGSIDVEALAGANASVSGSATGGAAALSVSAIDSSVTTAYSFGNVAQTAHNKANISNSVAAILTGDISGNGAAVSTSATGTVASVAFGVTDGSLAGGTTGTITQTSTNNTNTDPTLLSNGSDVLNTGGTLAIGNVDGDGASVSINATGAIAATSVASINGSMGAVTTGAITQTSSNNDNSTVTNAGSIVGSGSISGVGASAAISSSGSIASVSVQSIADTAAMAIPTMPSITQTVTNASGAAVTNTGSISLAGPISGNGASASVSATGAGAIVSFGAVN